MLHLVKRGRLWWISGQVNNRRYHQSLKTSDRTVAEALKRDFELQELSGGRIRRILWPDFVDEYERWIEPQVKPGSLKVYRRVLKRFSKFFVDKEKLRDVGEINPRVIAVYTEDRKLDRHPTRGSLIGAGGIKADLRILRGIFVYAVRCRYMLENPVLAKGLSQTGGKTLPFTEHELVRILDDSLLKRRIYLRAVVLTFLFTGMRISDIMRLGEKSLEISEGGIVLCTMKRGKLVILGLHPELTAVLREYLSSRNEKQKASPYLFATAEGGLATSLDTMLRRLFERAGISNGHPHRFRDTFAVRLLATGASLYDVSKMLGITTAVAERHYAPYVRELQERATRLIAQVPLPGAKVVQFQVPGSAGRGQFGQKEGENEQEMKPRNTAHKS
jgi:integrase